MMALAPHFQVKGGRHRALRPMRSGDGFLVRIRPREATLSGEEMQRIAHAAEESANAPMRRVAGRPTPEAAE
jgi:hypothetical protein